MSFEPDSTVWHRWYEDTDEDTEDRKEEKPEQPTVFKFTENEDSILPDSLNYFPNLCYSPPFTDVGGWILWK